MEKQVDFSLVAGRAINDRDGKWEKSALAALSRLALAGAPFTSHQLTKVVGDPPSHSSLAKVMRAAHRAHLIKKYPAALVGVVWVGTPRPRTIERRRGADRRNPENNL